MKQVVVLIELTIFAIMMASLLPSSPQAQGSGAMVVATCGIVPVSYTNVGAVLNVTMNTAGKLCQ